MGDIIARYITVGFRFRLRTQRERRTIFRITFLAHDYTPFCYIAGKLLAMRRFNPQGLRVGNTCQLDIFFPTKGNRRIYRSGPG